MNIKEIRFEAIAGEEVSACVGHAMTAIRANKECTAKFIFNGVEFELTQHSDAEKAVSQYFDYLKRVVRG